MSSQEDKPRISRPSTLLVAEPQSSVCVTLSMADNAQQRSTLGVTKSRTGYSVSSITSEDSGYIPSSNSARNSQSFEEEEDFPFSTDKKWPLQKQENCIPETDTPSPSSSQYLTAPTSQFPSRPSSFEVDSPQPRVPPIEPITSLPVEEMNKPFPRKRPPLGKLGKSQSVEPEATQQKLCLRRMSKTEIKFDPHYLSEALIKVKIQDNDLDDEHEFVLRQTVTKNAVFFRDTLNFKVLLAHLIELSLVHMSEAEFLNSQGPTSMDKANKFLFEILGSKGTKAYRCFYYALKQEDQHKGHKELVDIMTAALCSLVAN